MTKGGKPGSASRLVLARVMIPQDANIAGKVHGGNIMKLADTASACITLVALAMDDKPTPVLPLLLETEEDRRRYAEAASRVAARKKRI